MLVPIENTRVDNKYLNSVAQKRSDNLSKAQNIFCSKVFIMLCSKLQIMSIGKDPWFNLHLIMKNIYIKD